ncbi:thiol-disulfide oxidoreductase YkuV [Lentibacillus kapialis]|uniref:Thiol-disulfide oxidoreductase YkuV n=1 Tax=Lentibacillus kapialis TaxID=340214 RepID=A0A917PXQ0_9BACI|nr:redoxin domain-containing protein [Lentibacillus kapialis]GGJ98085.1 thiol-disulfide oxidoreductase YkuV [Lentibacillus kapialis]
MKLREEMPELGHSGKWLNSKPLFKHDLIGHKPIVIYFWSVSCDTCKKAMPKVNELCDAYNEQLAVIGVHMPRTERDQDLSEVQSVVKSYNVSFPILIDHDHSLTNQFQNKYVPGYYLFDTNGKLRYRHSGSGGLQLLQKRISRLI